MAGPEPVHERRPQGSAWADFALAQAPVLSIAAFFVLMAPCSRSAPTRS